MQSNQVENNEHKVIQNHLENKQSTHKTTTENSLAMAVPLLLKNLFPGYEKDQQTLEQAAAVVLKDLSELKEEKILENLGDIAKNQLKGNILPAIQKIIDIANEPLHPLLDTVTLYLKDPSSQTYKKIAHQYPIKYVLMLVYHAIFSDREKDQNQFITGAKDQKHRIESFYLCLLQIKNDPRCHTGTRNRLLALLNHTYKNVTLIEDADGTMYAVIKEEINKQFWLAYNKADEKTKKTLFSAYMHWLENNSPSELLKLLDAKIESDITQKLNELLIANGIDPNDYKLNQKITASLSSIEFTPISNHPQYDIALLSAKGIMQESSKKNNTRDKALQKMQDWIKNEFVLENDHHRDKINLFWKVFESQLHFEKYIAPVSLLISEEEINKITDHINQFFQSVFDQESKSDISSSELESTLTKLNKTIEQAKKNSMTNYIENFFAKLFHAIQEQDTSEQKKAHNILFNKEMQKKMVLTDSEIDKMKTIADGNYQDITPYQINRLFLHAIINKPENWSEKFYSEFKRVLVFVKEFKDDRDQTKKDLFAASYISHLINQLDYLNKIKAGEEKHIDRPHPMILLPDQVTSLDEWHHLCAPFNEEECKKLYAENRLNVNQVARKVFFENLNKMISDSSENSENRYLTYPMTDDNYASLMQTIMHQFNQDPTPSKLKINYAIDLLVFRIGSQPPKLAELFIELASITVIKTMINNDLCLFAFKKNPDTIIKKLGKTYIKDQVKNFKDFEKYFLATDSSTTKSVSLPVIKEHFEQKEMMHLVNSADNLIQLLIKLQPNDQFPLLNYLGQRHIRSLNIKDLLNFPESFFKLRYFSIPQIISLLIYADADTEESKQEFSDVLINELTTQDRLKQLFPTLDKIKNKIFPVKSWYRRQDHIFIMDVLKIFDINHIQSFFTQLDDVKKFYWFFNFNIYAFYNEPNFFISVFNKEHLSKLINSLKELKELNISENNSRLLIEDKKMKTIIKNSTATEISAYFSKERIIDLIRQEVLSLQENNITRGAALALQFNLSALALNNRNEDLLSSLLLALMNKDAEQCKKLANDLPGNPPRTLKVMHKILNTRKLTSMGLEYAVSTGMAMGMYPFGIFTVGQRAGPSKALKDLGKTLEAEYKPQR